MSLPGSPSPGLQPPDTAQPSPPPPHAHICPSPPALHPQSFTNHEALKKVFGEYGEVTSCYLPRNPTNPSACRGFAFVHFKHSFAADA